jgi:hypothetical protein
MVIIGRESNEEIPPPLFRRPRKCNFKERKLSHQRVVDLPNVCRQIVHELFDLFGENVWDSYGVL